MQHSINGSTNSSAQLKLLRGSRQHPKRTPGGERGLSAPLGDGDRDGNARRAGDTCADALPRLASAPLLAPAAAAGPPLPRAPALLCGAPSPPLPASSAAALLRPTNGFVAARQAGGPAAGVLPAPRAAPELCRRGVVPPTPLPPPPRALLLALRTGAGGAGGAGVGGSIGCPTASAMDSLTLGLMSFGSSCKVLGPCSTPPASSSCTLKHQ